MSERERDRTKKSSTSSSSRSSKEKERDREREREKDRKSSKKSSSSSSSSSRHSSDRHSSSSSSTSSTSSSRHAAAAPIVGTGPSILPTRMPSPGAAISPRRSTNASSRSLLILLVVLGTIMLFMNMGSAPADVPIDRPTAPGMSSEFISPDAIDQANAGSKKIHQLKRAVEEAAAQPDLAQPAQPVVNNLPNIDIPASVASEQAQSVLNPSSPPTPSNPPADQPPDNPAPLNTPVVTPATEPTSTPIVETPAATVVETPAAPAPVAPTPTLDPIPVPTPVAEPVPILAVQPVTEPTPAPVPAPVSAPPTPMTEEPKVTSLTPIETPGLTVLTPMTNPPTMLTPISSEATVDGKSVEGVPGVPELVVTHNRDRSRRSIPPPPTQGSSNAIATFHEMAFGTATDISLLEEMEEPSEPYAQTLSGTKLAFSAEFLDRNVKHDWRKKGIGLQIIARLKPFWEQERASLTGSWKPKDQQQMDRAMAIRAAKKAKAEKEAARIAFEKASIEAMAVQDPLAEAQADAAVEAATRIFGGEHDVDSAMQAQIDAANVDFVQQSSTGPPMPAQVQSRARGGLNPKKLSLPENFQDSLISRKELVEQANHQAELELKQTQNALLMQRPAMGLDADRMKNILNLGKDDKKTKAAVDISTLVPIGAPEALKEAALAMLAAKEEANAAPAEAEEVPIGNQLKLGSDVTTVNKWNPSMPFIFDDDVTFLLVTSGGNHDLVARAIQLWGRYIKRLAVFSDTPDEQIGTIVLENPHPDWAVAESRHSSWKIPQLIKYVKENLDSPFYFLMDDLTFPLLDSIRQKLDKYRLEHKGEYPSFISGRKTENHFKTAYWVPQQTLGETMFKRRLNSVNSALVGFDSSFLKYIGEYTNVDTCPLLYPDDLALAAIIFCSGGHLDSSKFNFLALTRFSPREKQIGQGTELKEWRVMDAYRNIKALPRLEEAFNWYYRKTLFFREE